LSQGSIHYNHVTFGIAGFTKIMDSLRLNKHLKTLYMANILDANDDITYMTNMIANSLQQNKSLEHLDLSDNHITMTIIQRALANPTLNVTDGRDPNLFITSNLESDEQCNIQGTKIYFVDFYEYHLHYSKSPLITSPVSRKSLSELKKCHHSTSPQPTYHSSAKKNSSSLW